MTNHKVGKTNTRDPRGSWRCGKVYKKFNPTNRVIRRAVKKALRKCDDEA